MAYSQGGIIAAADYNSFINGSNQLNTVWSTGTGNAGYGQTAISAVSQSGTVTATQWATLINNLNSARTHQSGSGSGISAVTAGSTINYFSTLQTQIDSAYTNRNSFATQGGTTTGSTYSPNWTASNSTSAQTYTATRTITFGTADQARYFFNCGGQINFVFISATNNAGTSRSGDLVNLAGYMGSVSTFRQGSNGGRSGTGGTVNTNNTGLGYYGLTTSYQTISKITATTSPYTGDYIQLDVKSSGTAGSYGDTGNVITFNLTLYSAAQSAYPSPPANPPGTGSTTNNTTTEDQIDITYNYRIDVVYPESTNLSNTWGTATVA